MLKKPEELVNENQLDIFWMHKIPVKNSSQVSRGNYSFCPKLFIYISI